MTGADLRHLRGHLLLAGALAVAGGVLLLGAYQARQEAHLRLGTATRAAQTAQHQLRQAQEDEGTTRETIARFQALQAQGLVGPEQRLEWIERLKGLQQRLALPTLDYEIRPRQLAPGADPLRLARSTMLLRVEVLHEEDFLAMLADLAQEPTALVYPQRCRLHPSEVRTGRIPYLTAECELEWLTLAQEQP